MPDLSPLADFRFLYRQTEGAIDRATWARASLPLLGLALALTVIAWRWRRTSRAISAPRPSLHWASSRWHVYFIVYAFVLLLCLVAEYFVSAKRFTDRGMPQALAGLAPFALLIAGALIGISPARRGRCRRR